MTIGFRSILVVNSLKNNNLFWKCILSELKFCGEMLTSLRCTKAESDYLFAEMCLILEKSDFCVNFM